MLPKAIEKLQSEMTKNITNSYIQVVGGFLLQHLNENSAAAEKIMSVDKTIAKSLDEMRKAAEKKKVGNCAVLPDQEAFGVVLQYFGIDATAPTAAQMVHSSVNTGRVIQPNTAGSKPKIDFDIKLEDLL